MGTRTLDEGYVLQQLWAGAGPTAAAVDSDSRSADEDTYQLPLHRRWLAKKELVWSPKSPRTSRGCRSGSSSFRDMITRSFAPRVLFEVLGVGDGHVLVASSSRRRCVSETSQLTRKNARFAVAVQSNVSCLMISVDLLLLFCLLLFS